MSSMEYNVIKEVVNLSHKLQKIREDRGMSRTELSKKSGVSLSFINYIEAGDKSPTLRTLEKLAAALGVTVGELLDTQKAG